MLTLCTCKKALAFSGLYPRNPLTRGSVPVPRWGFCPQILVTGSCSALTMCPLNSAGP